MSSQVGLLMVCFIIIVSIFLKMRRLFRSKEKDGPRNHHGSQKAGPAPAFNAIQPLIEFNWAETEPPRYRPFKSKYHLTMATNNLDPNDLLLFDKTYRERLILRRSILEKYRDDVVRMTNNASSLRVEHAIRELYNHLFKLYLPTRYPTIFRVYAETVSMPVPWIENLVTAETFPASADPGQSSHELLEILVRNIDEDFYILFPDSATEDSSSEEKAGLRPYSLQAFAACFPSGFIPADKLGKTLREIHSPIPRFEAKLQRSIDRFFDRLPVGRYVTRVNWSVTVDEELYSSYDKGGAGHAAAKMTIVDLDLDKTFLRCERQTLHRLPHSQAVVFGLHTYLYPVQDIKAEGLGEDLALAIDGLREGSVPEIYRYKNGTRWGEALKEYLTS